MNLNAFVLGKDIELLSYREKKAKPYKLYVIDTEYYLYVREKTLNDAGLKFEDVIKYLKETHFTELTVYERNSKTQLVSFDKLNLTRVRRELNENGEFSIVIILDELYLH